MFDLGPTEEALLPGNDPVLNLGILLCVGAGSLEAIPGGLGMPEPTGLAIRDCECPLVVKCCWLDKPLNDRGSWLCNQVNNN